jgi:hypothetical protein
MQDTTADPTPNPSLNVRCLISISRQIINQFQDPNAEVNDAPQENLKPNYEQAPVEHINTRPAMSFAAATSGPVGVSKEVSVSA